MSDSNQSPACLSPEQFHLPADFHFACHNSGRCCEDFWEIPLDETSLARLKQLPLSNLSPSFSDPAQYSEMSAGPKAGLSLRRVNGRCIFLDSARRCLIHAHFGAAAKPQTCQDFPFRYIRTPRGIFVGMSMACPSVRANRGPAIETRRQELADAYARSHSIATVSDPIELSPGLPISFSVYEEIESCLNDLLAWEGLTLDDRLIAGYVFLQLLERAVVQMSGHRREGPAGHWDECVRQMIPVFRNDRFRRVIAIARKAAGSRGLHRALIGLLLTYRSAFDARLRGRLGRSAYLFYQYVRHLGGLGSVGMPPLPARMALSQLRRVRADWNDPFFVHLLTRFAAHSLFRKDLIVFTPLLKGYGFLLVFVALMRWYAAGYAILRGAAEVGREDVDEAVGAVEKYYCFHTDFMRLFDQYPLLTGMVERMLAKPLFAPSMMRYHG